MTEQKLTFEFTELEANTILTALVHLPYKDSVALINNIHVQAKATQERVNSTKAILTTLDDDNK